MSALDGLSISANALQVLGFACNVSHIGRVVYNLFDKVRSANQKIELILPELQTLLALIDTVHGTTNEHATSPLAQVNDEQLDRVRDLLSLIDNDFNNLKTWIIEIISIQPGGWFQDLNVRLRWLRKEDEINAARKRIKNYTQCLTTTLSAIGRRNDIVLHATMHNLQVAMISRPQIPPQLPLVTPSQTSMQTIKTFRRQRRTASSRVRTEISSSAARKRPNSPCQTPGKEWSDTLSFVSTTRSPDSDAFQSRLKLNVFEKNDLSLVIDSGNFALNQFAGSLLMIYKPLSDTLQTLCSGKIRGMNAAQIKHLRWVFDQICASSFAASANALCDEYGQDPATSHNTHNAVVRKQHRDGYWRPDLPLITNCPTYMEMYSATVDTGLHHIDIEILSALTGKIADILFFRLKYRGNQSLSLAPLQVDRTASSLYDFVVVERPISPGQRRKVAILDTGIQSATWSPRTSQVWRKDIMAYLQHYEISQHYPECDTGVVLALWSFREVDYESLVSASSTIYSYRETPPYCMIDSICNWGWKGSTVEEVD